MSPRLLQPGLGTGWLAQVSCRCLLRLHRLGVPKDERLNEPTLSPRDSS